MKFACEFLSDRVGYGPVAIDIAPGVGGVPEGVTAVLGPNGSGKSTLGKVLALGRYAFGNRLGFPAENLPLKMLSFNDIHSFTGVDVLCHTQRLESSSNDYVATVGEIFGDLTRDPRWLQLCDAMGLHGAVDKRINYLSSGELRKLLIVNALHARPYLLVLDNPYIGLDAPSRGELDAALQALPATGVNVVMLLCDPAEVPPYASAVLTMDACRITSLVTSEAEIDAIRRTPPAPGQPAPDIPDRNRPDRPHDIAFAIADGHLRYGDRAILDHIDWTVRSGERWALTGPNGSGKSLLLSMVVGDHPQAYANHITLFDRRRGTGESVWEIKDRISYVCPEEQLYFRSPDTVRAIVARGPRPWLDRFGRLSEEELTLADRWLAIMGLTPLADRTFDTLSSGQQRMVLLCRAFIRQPDLLILDEPLHGLDTDAKQRVRTVCDALSARNRSALIFVSHYTAEIPATVTARFDLADRHR